MRRKRRVARNPVCSLLQEPSPVKPSHFVFDRSCPSQAISSSVPVSAVDPDQAAARTSRRRSDTGARQTRCRREWPPAATRSSRRPPTRQPCPEPDAPASTLGRKKEYTTVPSSRPHWETLTRHRTEDIQ